MDDINPLVLSHWNRDEAYFNDGLACAVSRPGSLAEDFYCFQEQQFTCTRDCSLPRSEMKFKARVDSQYQLIFSDPDCPGSGYFELWSKYYKYHPVGSSKDDANETCVDENAILLPLDEKLRYQFFTTLINGGTCEPSFPREC